MAVININDSDFQDQIASGLTLVDFWAEWCAPCRMVSPIVEELSVEMPNIKFAKLNVDENNQVPQTFGITAIPTLVLFKDGELVDRVVGLLPKPQLKKILEKHI